MAMTREAREVCTRGASRLAQGDLAGALAHFEEALRIQPECAEAWNNRGALRHRAGDPARALADFDRALEINPRYAEAYNNRGIVRHAQGDLDGALADFGRALELNPRYAEALASRGTTRQARGDLDGAVADFDRAIGIRPDNAEAYYGRASVLHARGDHAGALADYERVLALIPREAAVAVYHQRGAVYVSLRRFADAVADYDRALEIDPGLCMVYISRGNARYHLRDLAAQEDYWTAFQLDQRAAAAEIIRVLAADVREGAGAVLKNCRRHLRICPEDIVACARRGLTLLVLGRTEEAEAYLHRVVQIAPEWADYLDLLIAEAGRQRNREPSGR